jgi:hypothetical protein
LIVILLILAIAVVSIGDALPVVRVFDTFNFDFGGGVQQHLHSLARVDHCRIPGIH